MKPKQKSKAKADYKAKLDSLMKGLLIPNHDIWMLQSPESFEMLGVLISMKASQAPVDAIQRVEKRLEYLLTGKDEKKSDQPKLIMLH